MHRAETVTDTQIRQANGVLRPPPVEIVPEGTSSSSGVVSNRPLRHAQIKGKIAGGNPEADVGT